LGLSQDCENGSVTAIRSMASPAPISGSKQIAEN
jgi:hypothetical protein